ncbi:TetR/AcrR family transcriptional regulator [Litorivivens sp.]|uniref:TetR/AcrR family transcriptional regulator n=1 Tax=Litorivivens sp. TaxID=2020868 RepID=UPI003566AB64
MSTAAIKKPRQTKAEKTRAAILAAAENHFARLGFAATRLEDIADELELTRAALFYYFKEKQMLYDAMIADSFGKLANELMAVLDSEDKTIPQRIELAAIAYVNAITERPNLARLIMRFIADGIEQPTQRIFSEDQQLPLKFLALYEEGIKSGVLKPQNNDPFHTASALIGTSVFYVSALSALLPQEQFQPLDPAQAKAHREEVLITLRRQLGIEQKAGLPA